MTTKARAALQRKMVRLERNAVAIERFYQELQAGPPSTRTARHLRANRKAAVTLARDLQATRERLGIHPAGTVPPDSRVAVSK